MSPTERPGVAGGPGRGRGKGRDEGHSKGRSERLSIGLANASLHVLHVAVILFSCFGWLSPRTRPAHLVLAGLIGCSWFVLGPLIGQPGFCALTGVQHRVWRSLGRTERPNYMTFLYRKVMGKEPRDGRVEMVTQLTFYGTTLASIALFLGSCRG